MLINNLNFLSIPEEFLKVELEIHSEKSIALVYIEQKGYSLVLKTHEKTDSTVFFKTEIPPNDLNTLNYRREFISVIETMLDDIYSLSDIGESEKQHSEDVFSRLNGMLNNPKEVKTITKKNSKTFTDIEKGLIKLEIEILDDEINTLDKSISGIPSNTQAGKIEKTDSEIKVFMVKNTISNLN